MSILYVSWLVKIAICIC